MRIAYLDCASGISGDMMLGSLLDAGVDLATVQAGIDSLGLPSCQLVVAETKKCGFRALQLTVDHEPEHKHRHLHHIDAMIDGSVAQRQAEVARQEDLSAPRRSRGQGTRHDAFRRCISTRWGLSIRLPTSSVRRSPGICSAWSGSSARRFPRVPVLSKSLMADVRFRHPRQGNYSRACR